MCTVVATFDQCTQDPSRTGMGLSSDNRLAVGVDQRSQAGAISGSNHEVVDPCFLVDDYEGIGHQTVSLRFLKFKSFIHSILSL